MMMSVLLLAKSLYFSGLEAFGTKHSGLRSFLIRWLLCGLFAIIVTATFPAQTYAQGGEYRIIQFSGVIMQPDSAFGLPGVHIYVPKAGRGTTTNRFGYFSMPVLEGDSIVISSVGYEKQHYIIPGDKGETITIVIAMVEDVTFLPEIEVFPYPTEELLKEAILALQIPNQSDRDAIARNLDEQVMAQMFRTMPMDASMNYRYYMDQQFRYIHDGFGPRYNPLLNPFAWAEFYKSIKRGDLKRK